MALTNPLGANITGSDQCFKELLIRNKKHCKERVFISCCIYDMCASASALCLIDSHSAEKLPGNIPLPFALPINRHGSGEIYNIHNINT